MTLRPASLRPLDPPKISEFPSTPPHIPDSFDDIFEAGSFHHFSFDVPDPPEIFASFDLLEACEICDDLASINIMQEIAQNNREFLKKDGFSYAFKLSLNQTLEALVNKEEVEVSIGQNPFHESPRTEKLCSLGDLVEFWKREVTLQDL